MKTLWARVGVAIELSDSEYEDFIKKDKYESDKAEDMLVNFLKYNSKLDGETYFPEQGCFGSDGFDNAEEISFLF